MAIIDMRTMRYINLLDKITHVKTKNCFIHNNTIFFAVNRNEVSRAIGAGASNIRKMQEKTGRKIRIIIEIEGDNDLKRFIEDIIAPARVKSVERKENELIITAGNGRSKAALIGRDKRRLEELKKIVHDFFNSGLRIA
ncbi:hypothetical protein HYV50_05145 [Candidatus Pacearchaeota archaeon]|nr:hypothetical protein [Candidatus Pacearchaeota archaeon]